MAIDGTNAAASTSVLVLQPGPHGLVERGAIHAIDVAADTIACACADGSLRLFDAVSMAKQFDESAGDVVAVHEALRTINDSLGNAPAMLNSREAVAAKAEARAKRESKRMGR